MCCVFIWLKKKCTQKFTPVIREHPVEKILNENLILSTSSTC